MKSENEMNEHIKIYEEIKKLLVDIEMTELLFDKHSVDMDYSGLKIEIVKCLEHFDQYEFDGTTSIFSSPEKFLLRHLVDLLDFERNVNFDEFEIHDTLLPEYSFSKNMLKLFSVFIELFEENAYIWEFEMNDDLFKLDINNESEPTDFFKALTKEFNEKYPDKTSEIAKEIHAEISELRNAIKELAGVDDISEIFTVKYKAGKILESIIPKIGVVKGIVAVTKSIKPKQISMDNIDEIEF